MMVEKLTMTMEKMMVHIRVARAPFVFETTSALLTLNALAPRQIQTFCPLFVCSFVFLSVCLFACVSVHLFIHLSIDGAHSCSDIEPVLYSAQEFLFCSGVFYSAQEFLFCSGVQARGLQVLKGGETSLFKILSQRYLTKSSKLMTNQHFESNIFLEFLPVSG